MSDIESIERKRKRFERYPLFFALGLAIIFYAIGRYFTAIVGFVRARKAIVTEGVGAIASHLGAAESARTGAPSETPAPESSLGAEAQGGGPVRSAR